MPVYIPPALNAVDFELSVQPSHSVAPYDMALTSYTVPALNAVDFALVSYTQPDYNTIDFEFIQSGSAADVDPLTGALVLNGQIPSLSVSDNKSVVTDVGILTFTNFRPAAIISGDKQVLPGTGELILTGFVSGIFGDSLRIGRVRHQPIRSKKSFGWSRK